MRRGLRRVGDAAGRTGRGAVICALTAVPAGLYHLAFPLLPPQLLPGGGQQRNIDSVKPPSCAHPETYRLQGAVRESVLDLGGGWWAIFLGAEIGALGFAYQGVKKGWKRVRFDNQKPLRSFGEKAASTFKSGLVGMVGGGVAGVGISTVALAAPGAIIGHHHASSALERSCRAAADAGQIWQHVRTVGGTDMFSGPSGELMLWMTRPDGTRLSLVGPLPKDPQLPTIA